jgi:NADPH:quinone reductase-like Zn-dependent oxidoreductase
MMAEDSQATATKTGIDARVVSFSSYGGPETMLIHTTRLHPGPKDLTIKVVACSLNPVDYKRRAGDIKPMRQEPSFPAGLGYDASGTS